MNIAEKLAYINQRLPETTKLLAISKFHPASLIQEAYDAGQRLFGESREQELSQKQALLPKDIEWHFIGHLQTNKVKYIAPYIAMIHSVDSVRLLEEIDKQGKRCNRIVDCLLELHVAQEETKFGFSFEEVRELFPSLLNYPNVRIRGLMGMASNTDDEAQIRREFATIATFFNELRQQYAGAFDTLSMGMTGDWQIAVEEGSTMVRIGSFIFGNRI